MGYIGVRDPGFTLCMREGLDTSDHYPPIPFGEDVCLCVCVSLVHNLSRTRVAAVACDSGFVAPFR